MTVSEFVLCFHSRIDKIIKLDLKDELESHLCLMESNLDTHDHSIVVSSACGDYPLQAIASSLDDAYLLEELLFSSTSTDVPSGRVPTAARSIISSKTQESAVGHLFRPETSTNSAFNDEQPLFYTFLSADGGNGVPLTFVD